MRLEAPRVNHRATVRRVEAFPTLSKPRPPAKTRRKATETASEAPKTAQRTSKIMTKHQKNVKNTAKIGQNPRKTSKILENHRESACSEAPSAHLRLTLQLRLRPELRLGRDEGLRGEQQQDVAHEAKHGDVVAVATRNTTFFHVSLRFSSFFIALFMFFVHLLRRVEPFWELIRRAFDEPFIVSSFRKACKWHLSGDKGSMPGNGCGGRSSPALELSASAIS